MPTDVIFVPLDRWAPVVRCPRVDIGGTRISRPHYSLRRGFFLSSFKLFLFFKNMKKKTRGGSNFLYALFFIFLRMMQVRPRAGRLDAYRTL